MVEDDAWLMYGEGFNGHESETGARWKLALWAFYAFALTLWAMVRYWWIVGRIQSVPGASIDGEWGSTAGQMDWRAAGFFFGAGGSGVNPGAIAWYTLPYSGTPNSAIKVAMLVASPRHQETLMLLAEWQQRFENWLNTHHALGRCGA